MKWYLLCITVLLAGCSASAELTQLAVDDPAGADFQYIQLDVDLSKTADSLSLTRALIKELGPYQVDITQTAKHSEPSTTDHSASALLQIEEIERRLEAGEHHRTYGRTSLTQMRGRKQHEKPVISMRARLIDIESGRTVFKADYIAEGPWYVDSASVAASVAKTLILQLEREELIASNRS